MKYPRTYHLPFSPGATKDDKKLQGDWFDFYRGKKIVFTEKLDGENTCLCQSGVFARSHSAETRSPWSINLWGQDGLYWRIKNSIGDNEEIFGENLYGEHSIIYDKLLNYFHIFAANDGERWYSWDEIVEMAFILDVPHVPELYTCEAESEKQIEEIIAGLMKQPSTYGKEKEGIVMRITDSFAIDYFPHYVCKYVRPNHVQTDEHWTRNWKKAKLLDL